MSLQYDEYIKEHKYNVIRSYEWLRTNLSELFDDELKLKCDHLMLMHDKTKYDAEEYNAYDAYFYGKNKSYAVVEEFNHAWLHHIHDNPHHWQHWVLINDDPDEGEIILDMPDAYIIEMICDWWSFSWKKDKLDEIFDWYEDHPNIKLSKRTRKKVEDILKKIKEKLSVSDSNDN